MKTELECSVDECESQARSIRTGLCGAHEHKLKRHGNTRWTRPDLAERFWAKVDKSGGFPDFTDPLVRVTMADGECWRWTGKTEIGGYGLIGLGGARPDMIRAHRLTLRLAGIDAPDELDVDHLCRVRVCQNPSHLEMVTRRVNTHRGAGPSGVNSRKTQCKNGHEFTEENTSHPPTGVRRCRECDRDSRARFKLKNPDYQAKWDKNRPPRIKKAA